MPWDAEHAATILDEYDNCYSISPKMKGLDQLQKTYRYQFGRGSKSKHIVISRERNAGAVSAYVNARSITGNLFSDDEISGVTVTIRYPKGHIGSTGDYGIRRSVAKLSTLAPKENDVLLLNIDGPSAFKVLIDWYAGLRDLTKEERSTLQLNGKLEYVQAAPIAAIEGLATIGSNSPTEPDSGTSEQVEVCSSSYIACPEKRSAVEQTAVKHARKFYLAEGFTVEEKGKPYDLLCQKGELVVHVEVKGTTGAGHKVILTRNEVIDARNPEWRSDLFLVHGIDLRFIDDKWVGLGGTPVYFQSWIPKDKDLEATQFDYSVPHRRI